MKQNGFLTKLIRTLSSMKFGMILLLFMAISTISGTVLPQGKPPSFYEATYSSFLNQLIRIFHLDRVFTSWWFIILVAMLALNLLFCSVRSLPGLLHRMKAWKNPANIQAHPPEYFRTELPADLTSFFNEVGFKIVNPEEIPGGTFFRAKRHTTGWLGSWLTHLGILLIIVFYVFGKWFGYETVVFGLPGSTQPILDTGYQVQIDDFDILYRDDYSIHQYITDATILDSNGKIINSGSLQVNTPMKGKGFSLFQTGTGWALQSRLEKDGQEIAQQTIYQSDVFIGDDEKIVLQFVDFYPDFVMRNGEAFTRTPFPKNPRMLYSIYHNGHQVMMNVAAPGQPIKFLNYTFHIDTPKLFTALQVVSDPGTPLVFFGGVLLLLGIFLSFYWVPQELYGFKDVNGQGWIAAYAKRNQALFYDSLDEKLKSNSLGGN